MKPIHPIYSIVQQYRSGQILFELVTPAQAGVQWFDVASLLDTGLRRYDGKKFKLHLAGSIRPRRSAFGSGQRYRHSRSGWMSA